MEMTAEQMEHVRAICGRGLLDGHPLAIRLAASVAKKQPLSELATLRQELRERTTEVLQNPDYPEDQASVRAVLDTTWERLDATSQLVLGRLAVFEPSFRREAAAAVNAGVESWKQGVATLRDHQIIEDEESETARGERLERMRIHPVVQAYGRERLEDERGVRLSAGRFLVQTEYVDEITEGVGHLERAGVWREVWEVVEKHQPAFERLGYWASEEALLLSGLKAARERSDRRAEGVALGELGSHWLRTGEVRKAIEHYEQALTISREIGDCRGEGNQLGNLGLAYADLGQVRKAIEHYEQALAISREIGDRRGEGSDLGNLGAAYARLGEIRKAIEHCEQALAISREIGDRRGEGSGLGNLGLAYADLGQVRKAIEYYEQALAILREIGDRRGEGSHLGNLGAAYARLGEIRKAIEYYEQALAISREIGDRRGEGSVLGNLGTAYARLGEVRKAIEDYEQALAIQREIGDRLGEGSVLGNLGTAYARLGEIRKAIEYYEQALAIQREIGDRRGEGSDLGNLGLAYAALGEVRKAIEYYEQALAISREIGDRRGEGSVLRNLGLAYAALGEIRKAIEHYERALAIFDAIEAVPQALQTRGLLARILGREQRWEEAIGMGMSIVALAGNADVVQGLRDVFVEAARALSKDKVLAIADAALAEAGVPDELRTATDSAIAGALSP